MNFIAIYEGIKEAVEYIKSGKGPMLIEVETYRYRGHSMSDPAKYRSKEEVDKYKKEHDPINNMREYLLKHKLANQADLDKIEQRAIAKVKEAIDFAQSSPEPDEGELYTDVYVE